MTDSQTPYPPTQRPVRSRRLPTAPPRDSRERRRSSSPAWLSWLSGGQSRQRRRRPAPVSPMSRSRPTGFTPVAVPRSPRAVRPAPTGSPRLRATGLPPLPKAPVPVLYIIRLLVIGVGVAALTGTLLSVLSPAEPTPNAVNATATASRTESVINGEPANSKTQNSLTLTQEIMPLKSQILELQDITPGLTTSVYMVDLDTGRYVDVGGQTTISAASTIKLPILIAFFQAIDAGRIDIGQVMVTRPEQLVGGSGQMQGRPPGTQYTALEVATQMIINSDNTASNMMIELLGGPEQLNALFQSWGLTATVIKSPLPDLAGTNTTSAQELVKIMAFLHRGELLSLRSRDRVLNILLRTHNKNLIPSALTENDLTYNKTGDIASVLGDVALVDLANGKRYAIATLIQRPENDGRARELIRRASLLVHQEMQAAIAPAQPPAGNPEEGVIPTSESAPPPLNEGTSAPHGPQ